MDTTDLELASILNQKNNNPTDALKMRRGVVVGTPTAGIATVNIGGVSVPGIPYYSHLGTLANGQVVDVLFDGASPRVVGVLGAYNPQNRFGYYRITRAAGTIGLNTAHTGPLAHGANIAPQSMVVFASAFVRGNSAEAVPLTVLAVDAFAVHISIPAGYGGRGFNVNVLIDDTPNAGGAVGWAS